QRTVDRLLGAGSPAATERDQPSAGGQARRWDAHHSRRLPWPATRGTLRASLRAFDSETIGVPAPRGAVFERAVALDWMPKLLRGWGPVPGVERAELLDEGDYAVGKTRRIHNTDGSSLNEEILLHEPPSAHSYRLYGGFRGLAKVLVTEG